MPPTLRVLIVEDRAEDEELILRVLRHGGYDPEWTRVDNAPDFLAALQSDPDLILSDYLMPGFTGLQALELLRQRELPVPLIIVSGLIGEDTAVEAMRLGAADYVMKDRLARLPAAVGVALEQSRLRRERHLALGAMRESEEHLRILLENAPAAIAMLDRQLCYLYCSRRWLADYGLGDDSIAGRSHYEVFPDLPAPWKETHRRCLAGAVERSEADLFVRADGRRQWLRWEIHPWYLGPAKVGGIVILSEDITERKKLEEQFLRAQRMEAIGSLAGGIAHDLNNILTPVLMIAPMLREAVKRTRDVQLLDMVEQSAERGSNIIKQLLTFSRGAVGERGPVQVRHLLREIASIGGETFPRDISIHQEIPRDLWLVSADATQIHQVLMNLCVNARDAMPQGGRLTLAAENVVLTESETAGHPAAVPGPHVRLTVSDTGTGMPGELLGRIFEPFFSTKEVGHGTGLGLSTALGLLKSHGGFLTVTSEMGVGSVFQVNLPALPTGSEIDSGPGGVEGRGNQEVILVVDDEPTIRSAVRFTLENFNYRVVTATDGQDALQQFSRHRSDIRLVLIDIMMPVMGGAAFARILREQAPALPIVGMSGLSGDEHVAELAALGVIRIVAKPCRQAELLRAVREHLA